MKDMPSKTRRPFGMGKTLLLLVLTVFCGLSVKAQDVVYVSSYTGSAVSGFPPYAFVSGTSYSAFGSTAIASPPGAPTRSKTVYGFSGDCIWKLQPTLNVAGAVYKIETAHTAATTSTNALMTLYSTNGSMSASCTNTTAFDAAHGGNTWQFIGYITNNPGVTQPVIFFAASGGTFGPTSSSARLYFDVFKFTEVNSCLGVAGDVTVGAPLAANQTFVNVYGVDAAATAVTIYDGNDTVLGQLTSGIVAGLNQVPTSALGQGSIIKATQTKAGCTSAKSTGAVVGSGANPQIIASLSLYTNAAFAGPIGANTTSGLNNNYILKCTGLANGSQSAPKGGQPLAPSQCWQTVTFDHVNDPALYPNNGFTVNNTDPFCALDALVFAMDQDNPDSGPYDIYVDQIKNGDVVVEDFESYPVGSTNTFVAPNVATTPSPSGTFLTGNNSATISTNNAFDGTKSLRIRWQFADNTFIRWTRVIAGASTGKKNPQLDTRKLITIRYLVVPVGQTNDTLHFPAVPTARRTVLTNTTVNWSVTPAGVGGFTYQWNYEGNPIVDATTSAYSKSNVQLSDSGTYSVVVTGQDGGGCSTTLSGSLTVVDSIPVLSQSVATTNVSLTWTGPFMLQSSTNVSGPWSDVSTNQSVQQQIKGTKFFRLSP